MAGARRLTVVVADPGFEGMVPRGEQVSVLTPRTVRSADFGMPGTNFFVIAAATGLEPVAELVHNANSMHRLRALFVRADVDYAWFLPMIERANLRTLRNMIVHSSFSVPERVLRAWQNGAQDSLIADAAVSGDRIFVRSCSLKRFEAGFGDIRALATLPAGQRSRFTVDPDGSYLHWEHGDVHVSLDMIRRVADPELQAAADIRRLAYHERFGAAIRAIRLRSNLRQSDVDGLSAKQVSRIESGLGTPRLQTIRKLAAAHGREPAAYLDELARELQGSTWPAG